MSQEPTSLKRKPTNNQNNEAKRIKTDDEYEWYKSVYDPILIKRHADAKIKSPEHESTIFFFNVKTRQFTQVYSLSNYLGVRFVVNKSSKRKPKSVFFNRKDDTCDYLKADSNAMEMPFAAINNFFKRHRDEEMTEELKDSATKTIGKVERKYNITIVIILLY